LFSHRAQEPSGRLYNNADSFAMAFDQAWNQWPGPAVITDRDRSQRLDAVLDSLAEHPFVKHSAERARDVALFRIRLLGL